jgi:Kelch motif
MFPTLPRHLLVGLGLLAVSACAGSEPPTQPDLGADPAPATPLALLTSNTWTERAAYPNLFGAIGLAAGVITDAVGQSIVYALGGTDGEGGTGVVPTAYNVATNTWSPKSLENHVDGFNTNGVGVIKGKLYISGGYVYGEGGRSFSNALHAYDPATDILTRKADMPKFTADGVTGVIDGKLYVLPGSCSTDFYPAPGYCAQGPIRRLYRYNPATNLWVAKAQAPHYHASGAGGVINGKFYVAGGSGTANLDAYDPATNTWKTLAPLPAAGPARGAVLLGKLFVVVGSHMYVYNPATNYWGTRAAPKWDHPAIVKVSLDGQARLLAIGGVHEVAGEVIVNETELFKP